MKLLQNMAKDLISIWQMEHIGKVISWSIYTRVDSNIKPTRRGCQQITYSGGLTVHISSTQRIQTLGQIHDLNESKSIHVRNTNITKLTNIQSGHGKTQQKETFLYKYKEL